MIVVSACLAGAPCRYDGTARTDGQTKALVKDGMAVCACPECMAGLVSPRPPAEIRGGDGRDVLCGNASVYNKEGQDVTEAFLRGARRFLSFVRKMGATRVILKSKSPSCGVTAIYDGSFTGKRIPGCGVTAALLQENGIEVTEV